MARTKRVFISDIHLGSQGLYDNQIAWYNGDSHRTRLLNFINKQILDQAQTIKDVVLLGDIFDNWVCPADEIPPTWDQIFKDNQEEIKAFKDIIAQDINLFFIHGNHDFDLSAGKLQQKLPGIKVVKSYQGAGRSHAEHGHMHTLFNRPDYLNDPGFGRPIGYFLARLFASAPGSGKSFEDILGYVDDVVEAATTSSTLFSSIIEAMAERANKDEVVLSADKKISVEDLKKRYANLARQYDVGLWQLKSYIFQEIDLEGVGDALCKQWGFNVALFGHTHRAKIDKDWLFVEDRVYANTGAWCEDDAHFVTLEKYPIKSGLRVSLATVDNNGNVVHQESCKL